jgi:REP element-mobilizing transposase RayT
LITPDAETRLYAAIRAKCQELGCHVIAIGGIEDHVHILIGLPPALSVSILLRDVKGASSHLVTHEIKPGEFFKWQGAYGAFSVSKDDVGAVEAYIKNQKAHHAANRLVDDWEKSESGDEAEISPGERSPSD